MTITNNYWSKDPLPPRVQQAGVVNSHLINNGFDSISPYQAPNYGSPGAPEAQGTVAQAKRTSSLGMSDLPYIQDPAARLQHAGQVQTNRLNQGMDPAAYDTGVTAPTVTPVTPNYPNLNDPAAISAYNAAIANNPIYQDQQERLALSASADTNPNNPANNTGHVTTSADAALTTHSLGDTIDNNTLPSITAGGFEALPSAVPEIASGYQGTDPNSYYFNEAGEKIQIKDRSTGTSDARLAELGVDREGNPVEEKGMSFGDKSKLFVDGLKALTGAWQVHQGDKKLGLMKDDIKLRTQGMTSEFANFATTTNFNLERQANRIAGEYDRNAATGEEFLQKHGVSGTLGETGYKKRDA